MVQHGFSHENAVLFVEYYVVCKNSDYGILISYFGVNRKLRSVSPKIQKTQYVTQ